MLSFVRLLLHDVAILASLSLLAYGVLSRFLVLMDATFCNHWIYLKFLLLLQPLLVRLMLLWDTMFQSEVTATFAIVFFLSKLVATICILYLLIGFFRNILLIWQELLWRLSLTSSILRRILMLTRSLRNVSLASGVLLERRGFRLLNIRRRIEALLTADRVLRSKILIVAVETGRIAL